MTFEMTDDRGESVGPETLIAGTIDDHEPREFAAPKIRRAMGESIQGDT